MFKKLLARRAEKKSQEQQRALKLATSQYKHLCKNIKDDQDHLAMLIDEMNSSKDPMQRASFERLISNTRDRITDYVSHKVELEYKYGLNEKI